MTQGTLNWPALQRHGVPDWLRDAKFGIYFHWGPYAVQATFGEWYTHCMYQPGTQHHAHHLATYGDLATFGYKDFIPMFTGEHFDADDWAELFARAGARFTGPVAEHADGFSMWDSKLTDWCASKMGPKRDIVGAMETAVKARGLKFLTTFHHQWLWGWYPTWDKSVDAGDPRYSGLYGPYAPATAFRNGGNYHQPLPYPDAAFCDLWLAKVNEVVDRYEPDMLYFDSRMNIITEAHRQQMLAHYYGKENEWGSELAVSYKHNDLAWGCGILNAFERGRMDKLADFPFIVETCIDTKSWAYVDEPEYRSTTQIVHDLVDAVSKNGCLLLGITPSAQGEIPQEQRDRLLAVGDWLKLNAEAIYGTRPWRVFGDGPTKVVGGVFLEAKTQPFTARDIRLTQSDDALFVIALGWPEDGKIVIAPLGMAVDATPVERVELLGHDGPLQCDRTAEALTVQLPDRKPCDHAVTLRIGRARKENPC